MKKDLSIIIPVYNEEKYIGDLIRNLLKQDFDLRRAEVLVVNNNSTDSTPMVVNRFISSQNSLDIRMVDEPTSGVARARNKGGYSAKGKFLVFIDADNVLPLNFLKNVYQKAFVEGYLAGTMRTLPKEHSFIGSVVFWILEIIKITIDRPFGKSFCARRIFMAVDGYDIDVTPGDNLQFLLKVKSFLKKRNCSMAHIKDPIYASMRRFKTHGYISVLFIWFLGYLGWTSAPYTREYEKETLSVPVIN